MRFHYTSFSSILGYLILNGNLVDGQKLKHCTSHKRLYNSLNVCKPLFVCPLSFAGPLSEIWEALLLRMMIKRSFEINLNFKASTLKAGPDYAGQKLCIAEALSVRHALRIYSFSYFLYPVRQEVFHSGTLKIYATLSSLSNFNLKGVC